MAQRRPMTPPQWSPQNSGISASGNTHTASRWSNEPSQARSSVPLQRHSISSEYRQLQPETASTTYVPHAQARQAHARHLDQHPATTPYFPPPPTNTNGQRNQSTSHSFASPSETRQPLYRPLTYPNHLPSVPHAIDSAHQTRHVAPSTTFLNMMAPLSLQARGTPVSDPPSGTTSYRVPSALVGSPQPLPAVPWSESMVPASSHISMHSTGRSNFVPTLSSPYDQVVTIPPSQQNAEVAPQLPPRPSTRPRPRHTQSAPSRKSKIIKTVSKIVIRGGIMAVIGADIGDFGGGGGGSADIDIGVDDPDLGTEGGMDINSDGNLYAAEDTTYSGEDAYDIGTNSGSLVSDSMNAPADESGLTQSMQPPFNQSTGLTSAQDLAVTNANMNWAPLQAAASMNPTM